MVVGLAFIASHSMNFPEFCARLSLEFFYCFKLLVLVSGLHDVVADFGWVSGGAEEFFEDFELISHSFVLALCNEAEMLICHLVWVVFKCSLIFFIE